MHWLDPHVLIQTVGLAGVVAVIFAESGLFFGFFLPGDSLLFTAGLLASQGMFSISLLLVFGALGAVVGDSVGYAFGARVGQKLFTREDSRFFKKKYLEQTARFYEKHGKKTLILARFVPIVRTFAPILAGMGMMRYKTFLVYNIIGGVSWTLGLSLLGFGLGKTVPNIDAYLLPIIVFIVIVSMVPTVFEIWKTRRHTQ